MTTEINKTEQMATLVKKIEEVVSRRGDVMSLFIWTDIQGGKDHQLILAEVKSMINDQPESMCRRLTPSLVEEIQKFK